MTCSYRLDADADVPAQLRRYDGWQCERETHEESAFCIFHLPTEDKDATTVTRRFLEEVETEGRSHKVFVGAAFDHLDLSYASIDGPDNYPLVFHATEIGRLSLRKATVAHGVRFIDADVGKLNCFDAEFQRYVQLEDSVVGEPEFDEARFESGFSLERSLLAGFGRFTRARFEDDLRLGDARLDATRSNTDRSNRREPDFGDGEDFRKYDEFASEFDFEGVAVGGLLDLSGAVVRGDCSLSNANVTSVRLVDASLSGTLDVAGCTVRDADVGAIEIDGSVLPLAGVQVDGGEFALDDSPALEFRDAVLGDVAFTGDDLERTFERVRFVNTDFDGFDFTAYSAELAAVDWKIHDFGADAAGTAGSDDLTPSDAISTYLRAKNGADHVGDDAAAAEFFIREMRYRRAAYRRAGREGDNLPQRVALFGKWVANALLDLSSGYGERPSRTILTSIGVVGAFAVTYALVGLGIPYPGPIGYLVFSVESFVALIIGNPTTTSSLLSLVVALEGFSGAFLIALFVFTLTRSIKR